MTSFPLFTELEEHRDKANATFHHNTKPVLVERLQMFGFERIESENRELYRLTEKATGNHYLLEISQYEITVKFKHIKSGEEVKVCSISNFELSAHTMMEIIINTIDSWLQYGVIYDYATAQKFDERAKARA